MALQLQTPAFPWEAPLKMGRPFHSHFDVSTWRCQIAGPKGWHPFQGEWSKIKALHLEPRARYGLRICQVDRSSLFVLKMHIGSVQIKKKKKKESNILLMRLIAP